MIYSRQIVAKFPSGLIQYEFKCKKRDIWPYAKNHIEMGAQLIYWIFHSLMYETLMIDNKDLGNVQAVLLASDRSAKKSDFIACAGAKGVHMYNGVGVRSVDFISGFLNIP